MKPKITPAVCDVRPGEHVECDGHEYVIASVLNLKQVIVRNLETDKLETLRIQDLRPSVPKESPKPAPEHDLEGISREEWEEAKRRLEIIRPLIKRRRRGDSVAAKLSAQHGISLPTLYRWHRDYLNSGLLSSLLPIRRDGGRGQARLKDPRCEEALRHTIDDYYLTDQQPSMADAWEYLDHLCRTQGISTPHLNTLRKRLAWRARRAIVAARKGERVASMQFDPIEGEIGDAEWPLAMVQVDHTSLPVIIVDEVYRRSIRRAWVTFAIDVYSRMVLGMYLSLDPPSAMSAGMCISHAILAKERWLQEREIEAEWPCWGVMTALHMDNAKEFRGNMLRVACEQYNIELTLRPVKKPHYGGHIERLMGTVSQALKSVPGATFSGPAEKGEYDSEGNAIMTFAELERWLVFMIAKYHHSLHGGIGTSPLQRLQEGLLGKKGKLGRGLPSRRLDEEKVRIDFMPFEERTIQDYGVVIDDIHYFADVLRPWINAMAPENPRAKRLFRFRRDPRDISEIYFFEPEVKRYFAIPYRDLSLPRISLWEMQDAKREAKRDGIKHIDEVQIFHYARKMREEVTRSAEKTKSARRHQQKLKEHAKAVARKKKELPTVSATPKPAVPPPAVSGYDPDTILPFDDE